MWGCGGRGPGTYPVSGHRHHGLLRHVPHQAEEAGDGDPGRCCANPTATPLPGCSGSLHACPSPGLSCHGSAEWCSPAGAGPGAGEDAGGGACAAGRASEATLRAGRGGGGARRGGARPAQPCPPRRELPEAAAGPEAQCGPQAGPAGRTAGAGARAGMGAWRARPASCFQSVDGGLGRSENADQQEQNADPATWGLGSLKRKM